MRILLFCFYCFCLFSFSPLNVLGEENLPAPTDTDAGSGADINSADFALPDNLEISTAVDEPADGKDSFAGSEKEPGSVIFSNGIELNYYQKRSNQILNPDNKLFETDSYKHQALVDLEWNYNLTTGLSFRSRGALQYQETDHEAQADRFLLEGYLQWSNSDKDLFLDLGKKKVEWSNGFAWTPANVLIPKQENPDSEILEQEGIEMVQIEYVIGLVNIGGVVAKLQTKKLDKPGLQAAGKISLNLESWELTGISRSAEKHSTVSGLSFNSMLTDELEVHGESFLTRVRERKLAKKTTILYRTPGGRRMSEDVYEYYESQKHKLFSKSILGGRYTFSNNMNLTLEIYHNTHGLNQDEWQLVREGINQAAKRLDEPTTGNFTKAHEGFLKNTASQLSRNELRQNYLFLRWDSNQSANLWRLIQNVQINVDDYSRRYQSTLAKSWNDYFTTEAELTLFRGGELSEFGLLPYDSRVKISAELTY